MCNIKLGILIIFILFLLKIDVYADDYKYETYQESIGYYTITAYCPCNICCGIYSNPSNPTTASGAIAQAQHTIAADTNILPFGTEVVINGNTYTVEDVGGGVKGNHIDMYFNSHKEALNWGRQYIEVFVTKKRLIKIKNSPPQFTMKAIDEYQYQIIIDGLLMQNNIFSYQYYPSTNTVIWYKHNVMIGKKQNNKIKIREDIFNIYYKEDLINCKSMI